jgi:hypothetical protein
LYFGKTKNDFEFNIPSMKTHLLLLMMLTISVKSFSQFGSQQIIATNAYEATSVYSTDIDGDGDMDVLSASWKYDKIAWYENTDGLGTFSSEKVISTAADGADCVRAFDIDNDGDMDVLSASYYDNKVAWYENTDGKGNFGPQQIISTNLIYGSWVNAADIDGDGDLDVLSASIDDDKIAWYENTDGHGTFGAQQLIANPDGPNSVSASDIDGDGDLDIIFDAAYGNKIYWCENIDGLGTFGTPTTITDLTIQPSSIYGVDIDGDGDVDIISSSIQDNKIAWYENTDGLGTFGSQQIISTEANQARYVFPADFDNDGDMDLVSASWNDDKVAWYENKDGLGTFSSQKIISTNANGASCVFACDFDGDNKIDVVSSSYYDNKIAWYKNSIFLGFNEITAKNNEIYPNPVSDLLNVNSTKAVSKIEILSLEGQQIMKVLDSKSIKLDKLKHGIYLVEITYKDGVNQTHKIVKE